jgi:hypothetical protein
VTKSHRPPTARAMLRKWSNRSLFWRTALATIARLDRIEAIDARKAVLEVERQWLLSKHRVEVMIHDNAQYLSQLYTAKPVGPASGPSHMTVATRIQPPVIPKNTLF